MTTRETSRESFQQLLESGKLPEAQAKILRAVVGGPDRTSGEICAALELHNVNAWRARFTELQSRGLIVESGTRKCKISGRSALTWRYTERTVPLAPKGAQTSAKELRELIARAAVIIKREESAGSVVVSQWMASAKACGFKL